MVLNFPHLCHVLERAWTLETDISSSAMSVIMGKIVSLFPHRRVGLTWENGSLFPGTWLDIKQGLFLSFVPISMSTQSLVHFLIISPFAFLGLWQSLNTTHRYIFWFFLSVVITSTVYSFFPLLYKRVIHLYLATVGLDHVTCSG